MFDELEASIGIRTEGKEESIINTNEGNVNLSMFEQDEEIEPEVEIVSIQIIIIIFFSCTETKLYIKIQKIGKMFIF